MQILSLHLEKINPNNINRPNKINNDKTTRKWQLWLCN